MTLYLPQVFSGPTVVQFGADPTGSMDSTAAFNAAAASVGNSGAIRVPGGTYLLNGGNQVNLNSRMWIGDVSSTGQPATTLRARTGGLNFLYSASRTHLENLIIDANLLTSYALQLDHAHNTILWNVDCRRANLYALFSNETNIAPMLRVTCRLSANGAQFLGPNGNTVFDMRVLDNDGFGIDIVGLRSGETTFSGQMNIFGFTSTNNGAEGVKIRGVNNGSIQGGLISDNGGDGLLLDEGSADVLLAGLEISGDGASGEVAVRADGGAKICTFVGISVKGADPGFVRAVIDDSCSVLQFYGTRIVGGQLPIQYGSVTAVGSGANIKTPNAAAPTGGTWRRGAITWNSTPGPGSTVGRRCTTGGTPGTWGVFL